jgi:hypothetical protein
MVDGKEKKDKRTLSYVAVESIKDASETLVAEYGTKIAELAPDAKRPSELQLTRTEDGKEVKFDATKEQLASNFILEAINEKRRALVYQPAYVVLKNELLGPEVQIEKLAADMVKRAANVGIKLTQAQAMEKARAILAV